MRRLLAVLALGAAGLLAWWGAAAWDERRDPPGPPTPLAQGETPLAAVCRLRAEFEALPEPVYTGIRHHAQETSWKFAVGKTVRGPYLEIVPTESTRRFAGAHSRVEIVAALGPYVTDPVLAPKAVAVLAALPPGEKSMLFFTQGLARLVQENGRRGANWGEAQHRQAHVSLLSVYGMFSATGHSTAGTQGTLEGSISPILSAMQSMPTAFTAPDLTDQKRFPDFDAAVANAPLPEVSPQFRAFMQRWPREWLVTVLFPYAHRGDPFRSSPRESLVWIMGREAAYWPFSASTGFSKEKQVRAFEREVADYARGVCRSPA